MSSKKLTKVNKYLTERLKKIQSENSSSARHFARLLDINSVTCHKYLKGRTPPVDVVASICKQFNVNEKWILHGEPPQYRHEIIEIGESPPGPYGRGLSPAAAEVRIITRDEAEKEGLQNVERVENYVPIKLLADSVAGGDPREVDENDIEGYTVIYESWVKKTGVYSSIRIKGDSMAPVLREGDIVTINHARKNKERLRGKIVAAFIPHEGVTIKYFNEDSLHFIFEPANPLAHTIYADKEKAKIIGVIEWAWRKFD